MITAWILFFVIGLGFSLVLTPLVRALGIRYGVMDIPSTRKFHTKAIPRVGGVALFLASMTTIFLAKIFFNPVSELIIINSNSIFAFCGMLVVFGCGLWDDFRRLNPWIKLFFQILGATLAFAGGYSITGFYIESFGAPFNYLFSYAITVFWFLLFINAVNLIDGLDGLASGVVFFTCVLMVVFSYMQGSYLYAFYFSVLGGVLLGFLKYNFNPASIFLGDGGSYYIGYVVAILAIGGAMKSQVSALMLIPLLALGVPIFDTILSPIRRFIQGRGIFQPDKEHIHHNLLRMGLSSRNVVIVIYGITLVLCFFSILLIVLRGKGFEGMLFGLLFFGLIFLVRKMGYLEYLAFDKFYGWFQDVTDVAGFSNERRSFLSLQMVANKSQSMDELWENVIALIKMLKFDSVELYSGVCYFKKNRMNEGSVLVNPDSEPSGKTEFDNSDSLMRIEIPLIDGNSDSFGKLILVKDLKMGQLQPYTIRRVEHLRRTLVSNLVRLKK